MKLNYYVLWSENNSMLKNYLDKYYFLLKSYLLELSKIWILTKEIDDLLKIENRYFILNPDYSSIINLLYKELIKLTPQYLWDKNDYISKLKFEIDLFLKWNIKDLSCNNWKIILGTNILLTNIDLNPYNVMEAHPDSKSTWAYLWWWEKTQDDWLSVFEKTFELLKSVDYWIYCELNSYIKKIVPLWTSFWVHNSCSYKECIWHLYLWYTIDSDNPAINNLEAIIHESSHNKINLIMQFDPIILNTREEIYYSAIRPDARHIHWVFIWYHAFAPTMYIIMKAYRDGKFWNNIFLLEKIVLYHIKTKFLQKVIKKYAKLTPLWEEISSEIDYVIQLMDKMFREINPSNEIIVRSKEKQIKHFSEVNKNYPNLQY